MSETKLRPNFEISVISFSIFFISDHAKSRPKAYFIALQQFLVSKYNPLKCPEINQDHQIFKLME